MSAADAFAAEIAALVLASIQPTLDALRPSESVQAKPVLTVGQAAEYTGKSDPTIRSWIKQGLPTLAVDGEIQISRKRLDEWLYETARVAA